MYIITYKDIIDLNQSIEEQQLQFKLHLSDTCGRQSVRIEALGDHVDKDKAEEVKDVIRKFFENKGSAVHYFENSLEFRLES
jgi:hypothetical protein